MRPIWKGGQTYEDRSSCGGGPGDRLLDWPAPLCEGSAGRGAPCRRRRAWQGDLRELQRELSQLPSSRRRRFALWSGLEQGRLACWWRRWRWTRWGRWGCTGRQRARRWRSDAGRRRSSSPSACSRAWRTGCPPGGGSRWFDARAAARAVDSRSERRRVRAEPLRPPHDEGWKDDLGKLLNLDTFDVQILDSTEKLANISRKDVREMTMTSPMPSYRDKLTTQELADVVSYLMTLKGQ